MRRAFVNGWAIGGVAAALLEGIARLGHAAQRVLGAGLTPAQWAVFVALAVLLAYFEGHRALQRRFVPAVIGRGLDAGDALPGAAALWAPLYSISLVGDTRSQRARSLGGIALILTAVLLVRQLPQPWRGIVDGAVALALTWGLIALAIELIRELQARRAGRACPPVGLSSLRAKRAAGPALHHRAAR
jgi:hypothetical protein